MKIKAEFFLRFFLPLILACFIQQVIRGVLDQAAIVLILSVSIAFLFGYFLYRHSLFQSITIDIFLIFFVYCFWCILSSVWSEVPFFSLIKAMAFFLISMLMMSAGAEWVKEYGWRRSLDCFLLTLIVVLFSAVVDVRNAHLLQLGSVVQAHYQGLGGTSNSFGVSMVIVAPLILWRIYQNWYSLKHRLIWGGVFLADVYFILASFSRADYLILGMILIFFILSFTARKKLSFFLISCILLSFVFSLFSSAVVLNEVGQIINKGGKWDDSRKTVWHASYQGASKGGLIGGGYNVAVEHMYGYWTKLPFMTSVIYYAREPGNSQLPMIEQVGFIGFFLYTSLLLVFFARVLGFWRHLVRDRKVLLGLLLGAMLGLIVQSIFEGWWVGPFSQENICFWTMLGMVSQLISTFKREKIESLRLNAS